MCEIDFRRLGELLSLSQPLQPTNLIGNCNVLDIIKQGVVNTTGAEPMVCTLLNCGSTNCFLLVLKIT